MTGTYGPLEPLFDFSAWFKLHVAFNVFMSSWFPLLFDTVWFSCRTQAFSEHVTPTIFITTFVSAMNVAFLAILSLCFETHAWYMDSVLLVFRSTRCTLCSVLSILRPTSFQTETSLLLVANAASPRKFISHPRLWACRRKHRHCRCQTPPFHWGFVVTAETSSLSVLNASVRGSIATTAETSSLLAPNASVPRRNCYDFRDIITVGAKRLRSWKYCCNCRDIVTVGGPLRNCYDCSDIITVLAKRFRFAEGVSPVYIGKELFAMSSFQVARPSSTGFLRPRRGNKLTLSSSRAHWLHTLKCWRPWTHNVFPSCAGRTTGNKMGSGDHVSHTVDDGHILPYVILLLDMSDFTFGECPLSPEKFGDEHVPLYSRLKCRVGSSVCALTPSSGTPKNYFMSLERTWDKMLSNVLTWFTCTTTHPSDSDSQLLSILGTRVINTLCWCWSTEYWKSSVVWFQIDSFLKYSQEVPHRFKEDLRSELVFSLDAGHICVSTSRQNSSMSKWHVAISYPIQSSQSLLEGKYTMQVPRWKAFSRATTAHRFLLRWLRSRYLCGMPIFCVHAYTTPFSSSLAKATRYFTVCTLRLEPHFSEGWWLPLLSCKFLSTVSSLAVSCEQPRTRTEQYRRPSWMFTLTFFTALIVPPVASWRGLLFCPVGSSLGWSWEWHDACVEVLVQGRGRELPRSAVGLSHLLPNQ